MNHSYSIILRQEDAGARRVRFGDDPDSRAVTKRVRGEEPETMDIVASQTAGGIPAECCTAPADPELSLMRDRRKLQI